MKKEKADTFDKTKDYNLVSHFICLFVMLYLHSLINILYNFNISGAIFSVKHGEISTKDQEHM